MIATSSPAIAAESHLVKPGGSAIFTINVTNTGETPLNPIEVIDTLPQGMNYVTDDNNPKGLARGKKVIWPNVGPLDSGESKPIHITAKLDKNARGRLINRVSVVGTPIPEGYNITSSDKEFVDVKQPEASRNGEHVIMGDQSTYAIGSGNAANNIKIILNQK